MSLSVALPRVACAQAARRIGWALAAGCVSAWLVTGAAFAQAPASPQAGQGQPGSLAALWRQSSLLGDIGGLRATLGQYGISLGLQETSEVLGNLSGGLKQGATYDGMTEMSLGLDTQKAFGWAGGIFNISALQIHGRNLSPYYLDTRQTASGIEADPATRLWELWAQQSFLDGRFDIKLGQQSIDQEFMVSQNSNLFINTMTGWPAVPSYDLPSGGPAYPLSTPGVRLRAQPTGALSLLAGVFNGNAGGSGSGDPQRRNPSGTLFPLNNGVLAIAEIQYAVNPPPAGDAAADAKQPSGLPGTYKLGIWYDSEPAGDQEIDSTGLSLANPASSGVPLRHSGDYSLYVVADQILWRPDAQSPRSVNGFIRAMGAPDDRNALSFSVNGGLTLKAPLPGRDGDTAGIGFGYAQVSPRLAALDRDFAIYGTPSVVQSGETFIEATYQWQVNPWWQVQPDFQHVFNPGGGLLNPTNPTKRIGDETVLGVRAVITFW
jgi:porin